MFSYLNNSRQNDTFLNATTAHSVNNTNNICDPSNKSNSNAQPLVGQPVHATMHETVNVVAKYTLKMHFVRSHFGNVYQYMDQANELFQDLDGLEVTTEDLQDLGGIPGVGSFLSCSCFVDPKKWNERLIYQTIHAILSANDMFPKRGSYEKLKVTFISNVDISELPYDIPQINRINHHPLPIISDDVNSATPDLQQSYEIYDHTLSTIDISSQNASSYNTHIASSNVQPINVPSEINDQSAEVGQNDISIIPFISSNENQLQKVNESNESEDNHQSNEDSTLKKDQSPNQIDLLNSQEAQESQEESIKPQERQECQENQKMQEIQKSSEPQQSQENQKNQAENEEENQEESKENVIDMNDKDERIKVYLDQTNFQLEMSIKENQVEQEKNANLQREIEQQKQKIEVLEQSEAILMTENFKLKELLDSESHQNTQAKLIATQKLLEEQVEKTEQQEQCVRTLTDELDKAQKEINEIRQKLVEFSDIKKSTDKILEILSLQAHQNK